MNTNIPKYWSVIALALCFVLLPLAAQLMPVQTSAGAQRSAMGAVRSHVIALKNATRTAPNFASGGSGHDLLWQQFQFLRSGFGELLQTLNARQASDGANDFAELNGGLDILQEAFSNYQNDLDSGRSPNGALRDLCQILYQASGVWLQEFNKDCSRLRVGL
jgi:hypothetical protein